MFTLGIKLDFNDEIVLVFDSEEQRQAYIKKEYAFCEKARKSYLSCNFQEVDSYKKRLSEERVNFATSENFRMTKNKLVWRKLNEPKESKDSA
jgi:hypothetical protein